MTEGPEKRRITERREVDQKTERVWDGSDPVPTSYPYILPDYSQPFPHIGTETQTFIDNNMVEWLYDLERIMEKPQKRAAPVMELNALKGVR